MIAIMLVPAIVIAAVGTIFAAAQGRRGQWWEASRIFLGVISAEMAYVAVAFHRSVIGMATIGFVIMANAILWVISRRRSRKGD